MLEAEWNAKLRALDEVQHDLEHHRAEQSHEFGEQQRQRILALATDFPRLWNDPATQDRESKRIARLLIEDVTLVKGNDLRLGVRLRGGATRQLVIEAEAPAWRRYKTPAEVVAQIDGLLDDHTDAEIATILYERECRTGYGASFRPLRVEVIRSVHRQSHSI